MTLDQAIETLTDFHTDPNAYFPEHLPAAIKLGIEGLKRILKERDMSAGADWGHLPGETKE